MLLALLGISYGALKGNSTPVQEQKFRDLQNKLSEVKMINMLSRNQRRNLLNNAINQISDLENMLESTERQLISQVFSLREIIGKKVIMENKHDSQFEGQGEEEEEEEEG